MDVFLKHQLRIAQSTLRLTDEGAKILGGMTKEEARTLLAQHAPKKRRRPHDR